MERNNRESYSLRNNLIAVEVHAAMTEEIG